jgi:DNA topoisomerase-2
MPAPWYSNFRGTIVRDDEKDGQLTSLGVACKTGSTAQADEWTITELPVRTWTTDYKRHLNAMMAAGTVVDFQEMHPIGGVCFKVKVAPGNTTKVDDDPVAFFGLRSVLPVHLNLFADTGRVSSFATLRGIFEEFLVRRLALYEKRRLHCIAQREKLLPFLSARIAFVELILAHKLKLGAPHDAVCAQLSAHGIAADYHARLLQMSISSMTEERRSALAGERGRCLEEIAFYAKATPKKLWLADLDALEAALPAFWEARRP